MRWNKPKEGDTRIIIRFLFFPRTINGQTRWLELARIKQQYNVTPYDENWLDIEWSDTISNVNGVFQKTDYVSCTNCLYGEALIKSIQRYDDIPDECSFCKPYIPLKVDMFQPLKSRPLYREIRIGHKSKGGLR